ncbi:MAG: sorbosone dehydrogenase family protein [Methanotrichaceae archaeon]
MKRSASLYFIALLTYLIVLSCSTQMYPGTAQANAASIMPSDAASLTPPNITSPPNLTLKLFADDLTAPVQIVSPDDGTGRMFIADQAGLIRVIARNGTLLKDTLLDLRMRTIGLNPSYDERGLLGIALHPDFKNNSRIFVFYSAPLRPSAPNGWDHTDRLSEFNISNDNPNRADPNSEHIIMEVDHPETNNNGGGIIFGPDGYLYIPTGDGGGSDDVGIGHAPEGNAQNLTTLLGKILRIDVDNASLNKQYSIPSDNPFLGVGNALPEIFSYGFRNPSISFDASGNGSLFADDPGQMRWEEANRVTKGGNYGWNIKEGSYCFNIQDRSIPITSCRNIGYLGEPLIDPFIEYSYDLGQPIVDGFIYRGAIVPGLFGRYIFGYRSKSYNKPEGGMMAAAPQPSGGEWNAEDLRINISAYVLSIGEGSNRELYLLTSQMQGPTGSTGRVYKIVPRNSSG